MRYYAVASVLFPELANSSLEEWRIVEEARLSNASNVGVLHISWHVAQGYDVEKTAAALQRLGKGLSEFIISTTGFGVFSGDRPVLYLPVIKTIELFNLHAELWTTLGPISTGHSIYYSPEIWIPHITIFYEDMDATRTEEVTRRLVPRVLMFRFRIKQFSLIFREQDEQGSVFSFPFGGGS